MTREKFEQLSKAELVEIILQQKALIEQLLARVAPHARSVVEAQ